MEKNRVRADTRDTAYDWTLLGFVLAATLPFIVANGVLIAWRKRRYFQAQGGVFLIVGGSFTGLFWILSSFLHNGHFSRSGVFRHCVFWTIWSQGLGSSLWFMFTILRLHRMYLLSKGKNRSCWRYYIFFALCVLPIVLRGLAASKFDVFENKKICSLKRKWDLSGWMMFGPPYLVASAVILCLLRSQTDPVIVTEYMHTCEYLAMTCVVVLLSGIVLITDGMESISSRCFLTFCTSCLVFFNFWVRFAWPVYLCLCRLKEEMDRFEQELSQSGARALQFMSSVYSQRSYLPSSEGAVLEAFCKAIEEVETYKNKIRDLERQKSLLQKKMLEIELREMASLIESRRDKRGMKDTYSKYGTKP